MADSLKCSHPPIDGLGSQVYNSHWNVDPDIGSLEFANPAEAKKATALFERVQKEAFIAGVSAAAFACEAAWANYRDEHGVYGSEVAALISGAIAAVKASR